MLTELEIPDNLPFLESLCWQREGIKNLTPLEMLRRYERGWHYRGILAAHRLVGCVSSKPRFYC